MNKILSLDLGTSYLKAALHDRAGNLCGLRKTPTPVAHPQEGRREMDAVRLQEEITQLISHLGASSPAGLAEVAAVVFSAQTNSFLLLDSEDQPLMPLIIWTDERAVAFEDEARNLSRIPDFHRTTGLPALDRLHMPAKLLWLRHRRPDVWQRTKRLCLISDYLTLWLTGRHVTEAGTAGLLGILDIRDLRWWTKACDQLELPESWLPAVVRAGTDLGSIRPKAADALGLPKGCRFIVGCLDQYAGAIGAGNISPGMVSETTGTALATVRCAFGFNRSVRSAFFQGPSFDPTVYFQMLFGTTSANLLEWYRNGLPGPPDFESLTRAAADVPPGADGLRVRPDAYKGSLEDGFIGRSDQHTTGHAVRSIMETVAFALADQVEQLCGSERPAEVRSCGGAARSDVWLQIKADVLDVPFAATVCPEPTSLGAAMLAANTLGWSGMPDLIRNWVRTGLPHTPDRRTHQFYRRLLRNAASHLR